MKEWLLCCLINGILGWICCVFHPLTIVIDIQCGSRQDDFRAAVLTWFNQGALQRRISIASRSNAVHSSDLGLLVQDLELIVVILNLAVGRRKVQSRISYPLNHVLNSFIRSQVCIISHLLCSICSCCGLPMKTWLNRKESLIHLTDRRFLQVLVIHLCSKNLKLLINIYIN